MLPLPRRFTLFIQHRLIKDSWADELDALHASDSGRYGTAMSGPVSRLAPSRGMALVPDKDALKSMGSRALTTGDCSKAPVNSSSIFDILLDLFAEVRLVTRPNLAK